MLVDLERAGRARLSPKLIGHRADDRVSRCVDTWPGDGDGQRDLAR
ncbi:MAG: hypothetical protein IPG04_12625 [Polyangiaceae bacterium]|nr:hypothetical protein [Polyangiaceae bacterium]